ncbi:MAG: DUF4292 domain-containing protein [Chitinophagaceae bacterium]|nr:DUF4292 domain-containing protein [Chitinophagaceae bacterium]
MRLLLTILSLYFFAVACRPAKKIQKIQDAVSKVDTAEVVVVTKNDKVDSSKLIHDVYNKVLKNKIDFNNFSAKVKVDYVGKESDDQATAFIRIKKDSIIWISLRGALGIEGLRMQVTKDSVVVMYMLKKQVARRSINYLQEITKLPFDFYTLQDVIVGNPIYVDSNIVSYRTNLNDELEVLMIGKLFKHLVTLENTDFKILHSKLDDVHPLRNRTCDITFSDYDGSTGVPFATKRRISVAEKSKLDINLDYKSYVFNQPVSFPLPDTKNFKKL